MGHLIPGVGIVCFAACGIAGRRGAWLAALVAVVGVFVIHPWVGYSSDTDPNGEAGLAWLFIVLPLWIVIAVAVAAGLWVNRALRQAARADD